MSVQVSITCLTYNHELYIRKAIDSFLMQKTSFKYEILIHDDASTDGTGDILREYEEKFPEMIKVVYQKKNKYSQGFKRLNAIYLHPIARGKYYATCEGDDFWTDPYKLQKQYDLMESDSKYTMCIHATRVVTIEEEDTGKIIGINNKKRTLACEEMIKYGATIFHPSSAFYPRELLNDVPDWFFKSEGGHSSLGLLLSSKGAVYYINEVMSAWRKETPGGWTNRMWKDLEKRKVVYQNNIQTLKEFNKYTNRVFIEEVNNKVLWYEVQLIKLEDNKMFLFTHRTYWIYLMRLKYKERIKTVMLDLAPKIYKLLCRLKKKLMNKREV